MMYLLPVPLRQIVPFPSLRICFGARSSDLHGLLKEAAIEERLSLQYFDGEAQGVKGYVRHLVLVLRHLPDLVGSMRLGSLSLALAPLAV